MALESKLNEASRKLQEQEGELAKLRAEMKKLEADHARVSGEKRDLETQLQAIAKEKEARFSSLISGG